VPSTVRQLIKRVEDGWRQVVLTGSHRLFKHPIKKGRVTIAVTMSTRGPSGPSFGRLA
jgi:predicted RNA binding protein YcfA (HicA-like mRNA interferase family)